MKMAKRLRCDEQPDEPTKKKRKCTQTFRPEYEKDFHGITSSKTSVHHAFCQACNCDILISHGGRADIKLHCARKKHLENIPRWDKFLKTKVPISSVFPSARVKTDLSIIRAETLLTNFLSEHNLPIATADHCSDLFRKMFPDSNIAQKFSCGRTKASSIIHVLAREEKIKTSDNMKHGPFVIGTDGSNDGGTKWCLPFAKL